MNHAKTQRMHMKSFKTREFQKKNSKLGRPKIFSDPEPCRLAKNFIFWREQKFFSFSDETFHLFKMNPENYLNHILWSQCQSPMSSIFNNSQMINGLAGQISSPVSFSEIPEGSPMGQHGLQSAFQSPFNPHSQHNELNPPETYQVSQYH